MAVRIAPTRLWLSTRTPTSRPLTSLPCFRCLYSTSTDAPPPQVLSKLRTDLKTAMKARDTQRLNVLRALLAEITNSSKTSSPIKDDMALLSLLRKRIGASKTAVEEFNKNDRKDLVEKEQEQVNILEEYAAGVKTLDVDEIRSAVKGVVVGLKAQGQKLPMGEVLKKTIGPGGALEGKQADKAEVVRIVKEELAA
ncbi:GatB/YqeY domain-containing protein [Tothia fuscella]|uniref:Altered inheritance of mitochondria protein 41 n=1 Tax=Tothia fuscella TaxID=1048955 RepID=A0A9P4NTT0_9PEZI|nr:GatB/YqeY domain-containing protein [Tothia fuscella]